ENRAASALARTYPGGGDAFVAAMNAKAQALGMQNTRFTDATGLNSANVASAQDLALMVKAAHRYPLIRDYSTRSSATVNALGRPLAYRNTNGLVRNAKWDIGLSKTGFISEAGRCLVMQVKMARKEMVVVLLDSWGKYSRIGDATRIRKWLETSAALARRG
ncbi:MAG: peptidase, partial [Betaproteobacteria bacterium]